MFSVCSFTSARLPETGSTRSKADSQDDLAPAITGNRQIDEFIRSTPAPEPVSQKRFDQACDGIADKLEELVKMGAAPGSPPKEYSPEEVSNGVNNLPQLITDLDKIIKKLKAELGEQD